MAGAGPSCWEGFTPPDTSRARGHPTGSLRLDREAGGMHDGHGEQDGEELWGPEFAPGRQVAGFTLRERLDPGGSGRGDLAERGGRRFALKLVPMGQWGEREGGAPGRVRAAGVVGLLG